MLRLAIGGYDGEGKAGNDFDKDRALAVAKLTTDSSDKMRRGSIVCVLYSRGIRQCELPHIFFYIALAML
jgi:hypothetical protein